MMRSMYSLNFLSKCVYCCSSRRNPAILLHDDCFWFSHFHVFAFPCQTLPAPGYTKISLGSSLIHVFGFPFMLPVPSLLHEFALIYFFLRAFSFRSRYFPTFRYTKISVNLLPFMCFGPGYTKISLILLSFMYFSQTPIIACQYAIHT